MLHNLQLESISDRRPHLCCQPPIARIGGPFSAPSSPRQMLALLAQPGLIVGRAPAPSMTAADRLAQLEANRLELDRPLDGQHHHDEHRRSGDDGAERRGAAARGRHGDGGS